MAVKGKKYTRIQLRFLQEQYQVLTAPQLHLAFNKRFHQDRSFKSIRSVIRNHRMTCGNNMAKGWTQQLLDPRELAWLTEHYVYISCADITLKFNQRFKREMTPEQMKNAISRNKLKSGRTGCYSKGDVPPNKGQKMPPGWGPGRMRETQFKPGPRPELRAPIGHERTDRDGYIWVKCDILNPHTGVQGHYMIKHRLMWEEEHGPIPASHIVTFIDDDRTNVTPGNLECIPRGEQVRRNKLKYLEAPIEIRPSIKALAKLQHATGARSRQ